VRLLAARAGGGCSGGLPGAQQSGRLGAAVGSLSIPPPDHHEAVTREAAKTVAGGLGDPRVMPVWQAGACLC